MVTFCRDGNLYCDLSLNSQSINFLSHTRLVHKMKANLSVYKP
jgi:hypothetical protein